MGCYNIITILLEPCDAAVLGRHLWLCSNGAQHGTPVKPELASVMLKTSTVDDCRDIACAGTKQ